MAAAGPQIEAVKSALNSSTASSATVSALQQLLGPDTPNAGQVSKKTITARSNATSSKPASVRNGKKVGAKTKETPPIAVLEDEPKPLSGRAKYALATETANKCLKLLTDSLKPQNKAESTNGSSPTPPTPNTPSKRALQPRSGNTTPVRSPPKKSNAAQKTTSHPSNGIVTVPSPDIVALAQCARCAFAFLRSLDTLALGVPEMPRFQLETGMLALIGKLIGHGLVNVAAKELRLTKRSLESVPGMRKGSKATKPSRTAQSEHSTVADLLTLDVCAETSPEATSVLITYHQHVLRLICTSPEPAAVEAAAQHLSLEAPAGIVALIVRQMKQTRDRTKAVKQLDALSHTVLSLCPSVASTADEIAKDPNQSPEPGAVLKLQTLALRIRQLGWKLAKHEADMSKDLLDPFLKCASGFLRRRAKVREGAEDGDVLAECVESLGTFESSAIGQALFSIHNLLCSQAERADKHQQALRWAEELVRDVETLELNHARRIAALVKKAALLIGESEGEDDSCPLDPVSEGLLKDMKGDATDYDLLLGALFALSRVTSSHRQASGRSRSTRKCMALAAGFAQRYARVYPGQSILELRVIIDAALRSSNSTDDLLAWVTEDAANVFKQAGTIKLIAKVATERPIAEAWSASSAALSLDRIVRALVLRALRSDANSKSCYIYDDERLETTERGALLEWQLRYIEELAPATRAKYDTALKKLLPDLLRRLSRIFAATLYPIRRARVATIAFGLRESHPELLPPHVFKVWHDAFVIDAANLGNDIGFSRYYRDMTTRLSVARLFMDSQPSTSDLKPLIETWQRIINDHGTSQSLCDSIEDFPAFAQQLRSIAAYLCMLGEDAAALGVRQLLTKLNLLSDSDSSATCTSLVEFGRQFLELGYSERAGTVFARAQKTLQQEPVSEFVKLQLQLAYAEYLLAIDNVDKCRTALEEARKLRSELPPDKTPLQYRRAYELLHAQGWLVHSKYMLETGFPHDALASAKRSVKILNSIWSALERLNGDPQTETAMDASEAPESSINDLTKGVSKLQLTSTEGDKSANGGDQNRKGAAFWPVVPVLVKALLHLSDMYAHHGIFTEANAFAQHAVTIAKSVGSTTLLSRLQSHRSQLLTLAGRTEEAELCLAQDEVLSSDVPSMAAVERQCAKAAIRAKEGSLQDAIALYEKAEGIVDVLSSESFLERLGDFDGKDDVQSRTASLSLEDGTERESILANVPTVAARKVGKRLPRKAPRNVEPDPRGRKSGTVANRGTVVKRPDQSCYLLPKLKGQILLEKALLHIRLGQNVEEVLAAIERTNASTAGNLRRRHVRHLDLMHNAAAMLQADVTLNVLAESTLSFPALMKPNRRPSEPSVIRSSLLSPTHVTTAVVPSSTKSGKRAVAKADRSEDLLDAARDCLMKHHAASVQFCGTAQTHAECSSLSSVNLLLSAISKAHTSKALHPIREGLAIDLPRVKALRFEQNAANLDGTNSDDSGPRQWPGDCDGSVPEVVSAAKFQEEYIDILPKSWTAVSLCLSEDCSELYIARYRTGQSPLILKLPFSLHKPDDLEEEAFDYHKGKAELQEIIELSNYTCHDTGGLEVKGAKTKWWNERAGLDRRLHELLINIENIWFGGFKAIFSQHQRQEDLLSRFRKSFDQILDRYLPSRKSAKCQNEKLALDSKVLELFIGLGNDQEGTADLEEPMADLLYFVVDMLQFSGERNAYDEIDFDSMAVDVLDALRAYHEVAHSRDTGHQHLILVLDRRLQAFPWESLPYLEAASVSRVGSMLSLRQRIVAMRLRKDSVSTVDLPDGGEGCHVVPRTSGTYILNPASNLPNTQTTLNPTLSNLTKGQDANWTLIVDEEPDEARFSSALSDSRILLYFGHGGGTQYIRPRTIKRLERCSEVIWLMGCSSGAVYEYGELEPNAIPLAYLLAGSENRGVEVIEKDIQEGSGRCMAVVATLWDVTDKDIDRFSLAVGEEWGLWPASEGHKLPAKTPRKREFVAAPSTPVQIPKTPKTPKVLKTPAPVKTPARSRGRPPMEGSRKRSLVEAVARSRDACYLRYLNGAAPVVYGVPVYLGD